MVVILRWVIVIVIIRCIRSVNLFVEDDLGRIPIEAREPICVSQELCISTDNGNSVRGYARKYYRVVSVFVR